MSSRTSRIFVGRLNYDVRERDLERFFRDYGKINDINLKRGYAFVDFDDYRDADDAVHDLDGRELCGDRVVVEFQKSDPHSSRDRRGGGGGRYRSGPYNTKYRVIIDGISSSTNWRDLKDFFRRVAEVTFADAHRFRQGEGVADFRSYDDMRAAIKELDDTKLNGRRVRISEDKSSNKSRSRSRSPRGRRSRSRSRDRGRSRSRSRGRSRSKSRERSRSKPRDRSKSKSRDRSKSKSREASRSKSRDRSRSKSRDQSRSKSRERSRSKSIDRSKSRSRERSTSKSRDRKSSGDGADEPERTDEKMDDEDEDAVVRD